MTKHRNSIFHSHQPEMKLKGRAKVLSRQSESSLIIWKLFVIFAIFEGGEYTIQLPFCWEWNKVYLPEDSNPDQRKWSRHFHPPTKKQEIRNRSKRKKSNHNENVQQLASTQGSNTYTLIYQWKPFNQSFSFLFCFLLQKLWEHCW